jgi:hypothetical protein
MILRGGYLGEGKKGDQNSDALCPSLSFAIRLGDSLGLAPQLSLYTVIDLGEIVSCAQPAPFDLP